LRDRAEYGRSVKERRSHRLSPVVRLKLEPKDSLRNAQSDGHRGESGNDSQDFRGAALDGRWGVPRRPPATRNGTNLFGRGKAQCLRPVRQRIRRRKIGSRNRHYGRRTRISACGSCKGSELSKLCRESQCHRTQTHLQNRRLHRAASVRENVG